MKRKSNKSGISVRLRKFTTSFFSGESVDYSVEFRGPSSWVEFGRYFVDLPTLAKNVKKVNAWAKNCGIRLRWTENQLYRDVKKLLRKKSKRRGGSE